MGSIGHSGGTSRSINSHSSEIRQENEVGLALRGALRLHVISARCSQQRILAAVPRSDHSAAIIECRCAKYGGIERGFEPHDDDASDASLRVLRASRTMVVAPQPKLIPQFLRAFVLPDGEGYRGGRREDSVAVTRDAFA